MVPVIEQYKQNKQYHHTPKHGDKEIPQGY